MLKFGMPTLLEAPTPAKSAVIAAELGLDFVELNQNLPSCQNELLDTDELFELSKWYNIFFTLHLDEQLDFCNFNMKVADAWLDTFAGALRIARTINCPTVNMHLPCGVYFTLPDGKHYLYNESEKYCLERVDKLIKVAERELSGTEITVCIENTSGWQTFQIRWLEAILRSDKFALTLDTGHSAARSRVDEPFICESGKLRHMHLHDYDGMSDHLPIGAGKLDIGAYLNLARRQEINVVVETKTLAALRESVKKLKEEYK
ncbi:MAG: sugar phosphate isomerase/epimerase [Clostridiales bacterium]|nr:sugar phosphate isomerase/epimerase [Clostridiales bacterium]